MSIMQLLVMAIGGAIGTLCRYLLVEKVQNYFNQAFPYGILIVNILGCLLMGICVALIIERFQLNDLWRMAIIIGVLGGFTTFSSFSMDTIHLISTGRFAIAITYIMASVGLCLLSTALGLYVGRAI